VPVQQHQQRGPHRRHLPADLRADGAARPRHRPPPAPQGLANRRGIEPHLADLAHPGAPAQQRLEPRHDLHRDRRLPAALDDPPHRPAIRRRNPSGYHPTPRFSRRSRATPAPAQQHLRAPPLPLAPPHVRPRARLRPRGLPLQLDRPSRPRPRGLRAGDLPRPRCSWTASPAPGTWTRPSWRRPSPTASAGARGPRPSSSSTSTASRRTWTPPSRFAPATQSRSSRTPPSPSAPPTRGATRNPSAASAAWCSAAPRRRSPGCALATQAREPAPHYEHTRIGHNYRMSNIAAAIGRGQLTAIEQRLARRRAIFYHYVKRLGSPRASPSCPSPRMLTRVEDRERAALRVALAEVGLAKAAMGVRPSHLDTAARGAPHYVHSCTPVHTDPALKGADTHQSQQATVSGPASCPH